MPSIAARQGPVVVELTDAGSQIRWGDRPGTGETVPSVLECVIARMRWENNKDRDPARERSIAIQRAEESLHWLQELERRRSA